MTNEESKRILKHLRVMFPAWYAWFSGLDTAQETSRVWERSLESQEFCDCLDAIDAWQTGRVACPQNYERDRLVFLLVEQARVIRNARYTKDQARSQIESYTQAQNEAEQRRASYRPLKIDGLGAAGVKFSQAVDAIGKPKSQWTREDLEAYRAKAVAIAAEFAQRYR